MATGLLLTGAELAAFGVTRRQSALLLASPWALCAAWLVVARSSIDDGAVWFTVPVGLTVLVTVALARRQRRDEGHEPGSRLLSALEFLGVALMVVTPITEAIVTNLAHVAVSLAIGVGLAAWGVVTRVRHRLAAGAVVVVISLLVLVAGADGGRDPAHHRLGHLVGTRGGRAARRSSSPRCSSGAAVWRVVRCNGCTSSPRAGSDRPGRPTKDGTKVP